MGKINLCSFYRISIDLMRGTPNSSKLLYVCSIKIQQNIEKYAFGSIEFYNKQLLGLETNY
ncbi:hypothetical protein AsAng_0020680 [Aureispira anguillae]|uniref:Uncharacterized protein n=1 Tax=Aureispira anguillae TaxID=2864201 RepID=A0A915YE61_9BACT|nr:hypothetical protein AsAng_0020680 [Aureispira anguillae]